MRIKFYGAMTMKQCLASWKRKSAGYARLFLICPHPLIFCKHIISRNIFITLVRERSLDPIVFNFRSHSTGVKNAKNIESLCYRVASNVEVWLYLWIIQLVVISKRMHLKFSQLCRIFTVNILVHHGVVEIKKGSWREFRVWMTFLRISRESCSNVWKVSASGSTWAMHLLDSAITWKVIVFK